MKSLIAYFLAFVFLTIGVIQISNGFLASGIFSITLFFFVLIIVSIFSDKKLQRSRSFSKVIHSKSWRIRLQIEGIVRFSYFVYLPVVIYLFALNAFWLETQPLTENLFYAFALAFATWGVLWMGNIILKMLAGILWEFLLFISGYLAKTMTNLNKKMIEKENPFNINN